jgi:hypothetical protein
MFWLRRRVVPKTIQILMVFLVVAITTNDLEPQSVSLNSTFILKQATFCNDDPGNAERHVIRVPKYLSRCGDNAQSLHQVIRNYLDQFNGLLVPAPPSIFFQPDRAPPESI